MAFLAFIIGLTCGVWCTIQYFRARYKTYKPLSFTIGEYIALLDNEPTDEFEYLAWVRKKKAMYKELISKPHDLALWLEYQNLK